MKTYLFRYYFSVRVTLLLVILGVNTLAMEKSPILEYKFNGSGAYEESSGVSAIPMKLFKGKEAADIRTLGGLGVSGSLGDKALDCTKDINGLWGWAVHDKDFEEIDGLK